MKESLTILFLLLWGLMDAQTSEYPITRPLQDGLPTKVMVGVYVLDIEKINNREQSFTLDVTIRLRWKDSRLSKTD